MFILTIFCIILIFFTTIESEESMYDCIIANCSRRFLDQRIGSCGSPLLKKATTRLGQFRESTD